MMEKKYPWRTSSDTKTKSRTETRRNRSIMLAAVLLIVIMIAGGMRDLFAAAVAIAVVAAVVFLSPRLLRKNYIISDSSILLGSGDRVSFVSLRAVEAMNSEEAKRIMVAAPNRDPDDFPVYGYCSSKVLVLPSSKIEEGELHGRFVHLSVDMQGKGIYEILLAPEDVDGFVADIRSIISVK